MYIIFLYQIVINAICCILNENIFMHSIRQIDVKKIRIPDKKYFLDPCPTLLCTEPWMKEDVQEKIKHKQDQQAHCGL